jgi:hypothetical protein
MISGSDMRKSLTLNAAMFCFLAGIMLLLAGCGQGGHLPTGAFVEEATGQASLKINLVVPDKEMLKAGQSAGAVKNTLGAPLKQSQLTGSPLWRLVNGKKPSLTRVYGGKVEPAGSTVPRAVLLPKLYSQIRPIRGSLADVQVRVKIRLVNRGQFSQPFTEIIKTFPVASDGSANILVPSLPVNSACVSVEIIGGHREGYRFFHGGIDLKSGSNDLYLAPPGSLQNADLVATVMIDAVNDAEIYAVIPADFCYQINRAISLTDTTGSNVYEKILARFAANMGLAIEEPLATVTFFTNYGNGGTLSVTVDGYGTRTSDYHFPTGQPALGDSDCANFQLPVNRTYTYSASTADGIQWSGSFGPLQPTGFIQKLSYSPPPSGMVSFYTDYGAGGNLTVSLQGYGSKTTDKYFPSSEPLIGDSGCVNFLVECGSSYSFTATTDDGTTWSGTVGPVSESGLLYKLNKPSSGGGGSGGQTDIPTPETMFMARQGARLAVGGQWYEGFTLYETKTFVFHFVSQYSCQAAIIEESELGNFTGNRSFYGHSFDNLIGFKTVTLAAGNYYLAARNTSNSDNIYSIELDYDISFAASVPVSYVDLYVSGTDNLGAGGWYIQPFTIQDGFAYFMDGCNSGLEVYIISNSEISNFQAGNFTYYSDYGGDSRNLPGLWHLKLPPGDYALAMRNSTSESHSFVYMLERWRIN